MLEYSSAIGDEGTQIKLPGWAGPRQTNRAWWALQPLDFLEYCS